MSATALPRTRRRPRRPNWTARLRRISQAVFVGLILAMSVRHNLVEGSGQTASIDALCPFGAVETLWRFITTGQFVPKTHLSNLILGAGLLIGIVLAGSSFCGWVCPFGALQDALTWLRKAIRLPEIKVPAKADHILRYGRFVTLGLILLMTVSTVKLWFAGFDPYRTLFGLEWLFNFNLAEFWPAYLIVAIIVTGSLLIQRFWCRYLCPLGGLMSLRTSTNPRRRGMCGRKGDSEIENTLARQDLVSQETLNHLPSAPVGHSFAKVKLRVAKPKVARDQFFLI